MLLPLGIKRRSIRLEHWRTSWNREFADRIWSLGDWYCHWKARWRRAVCIDVDRENDENVPLDQGKKPHCRSDHGSDSKRNVLLLRAKRSCVQDHYRRQRIRICWSVFPWGRQFEGVFYTSVFLLRKRDKRMLRPRFFLFSRIFLVLVLRRSFSGRSIFLIGSRPRST